MINEDVQWLGWNITQLLSGLESFRALAFLPSKTSAVARPPRLLSVSLVMFEAVASNSIYGNDRERRYLWLV